MVTSAALHRAQARVEKTEREHRAAIEARDQIIREMAKTMSLRTIAADLGISFQRIHAITSKKGR
jgi:hypothetical protein